MTDSISSANLSADVDAIVLGVLVGIIVVKVAFFTLAKSLLMGSARLFDAYAIILTLFVGIQC